VEPKQTETGQYEDQQGKIRAKQSETNREKMKKVRKQGVGLCYYGCFAFKVVSSQLNLNSKTNCFAISRDN
jgi:ABC-type branched-subunit amino acid transport system ATPase component